MEGIKFGDCLASKDVVEIKGTSINFLNINDLIKAKKESGRSQDLADAEKLQEIKEIG